MKKALRIVGIGLGGLIGMVLLAAVVLYAIGNARLNRVYDFPASNLTLPTDPASLELGKHRVESLCQGCHGEDLGGIERFFDGGPLGILDSANITSGEGGIGSTYTTEDYVRAVRHGIGRDGRPIFMPAVVSTAHFSDEELGAIIAYLKTVPPVDRTLQGQRFSPLAKILLAAGRLGELPVEVVSHETHVQAPPMGITVEYGEYIVNTYDCRICHGEQLNGGRHANPTIPIITPNLTPGGELAFWEEEDFINALREGVTPSGHRLNPELMPWMDYARLYDEELQAVWLYLQSLPALPQYTE
jgi:cytochrome c5